MPTIEDAKALIAPVLTSRPLGDEIAESASLACLGRLRRLLSSPDFSLRWRAAPWVGLRGEFPICDAMNP